MVVYTYNRCTVVKSDVLCRDSRVCPFHPPQTVRATVVMRTPNNASNGRSSLSGVTHSHARNWRDERSFSFSRQTYPTNESHGPNSVSTGRTHYAPKYYWGVRRTTVYRELRCWALLSLPRSNSDNNLFKQQQ